QRALQSLRRRRRRTGHGRPRHAVPALPAQGRGGRVCLPRTTRRACLEARLPVPAPSAPREPQPPLSVYDRPGLSPRHRLEHRCRPGGGDRHRPAKRPRPHRPGDRLTRPVPWSRLFKAMADTTILPSDADRTGRDFGEDELALLREVIDSGTLNCTKGTQEKAFAARYGVPHARAPSSGTAACHAAIAAINPEPGDEIITTSITDMGAIAPILYQQAIPVFADVDPVSLNVTPEAVAARITRRTRAIIATHLFGNPCNVGVIKAIADAYGIPVIEDCAQAFLAQEAGRLVGTIGTIGAFSLQQGKHMTTGEGGVVITADPAHARRMTLFGDKGWGYGDPEPDHEFLALNYRMTDLQGAVARAQLTKLDGVVARRRASAARLTEQLAALPG